MQVDISGVLFPRPAPTYDDQTLERIVYIPKKVKRQYTYFNYNEKTVEFAKKLIPYLPFVKTEEIQDVGIVCSFYEYKDKSDTLMVCFHANAEDVGKANDLYKHFRDELKIQVHVLGVEYPGYGIYPGNPSAEEICADAVIIYDFLTKGLRFPPERILIFGRSIGSGPAIFLASRRKIGGLVLMAPFSNLKTLARDLVGKAAEGMIEEKFHNLKDMEVVTCPTIFLHGAQDELIPLQHSKDLVAVCQGVSELAVSEDMKHNEYRVFADVVNPMSAFLQKNVKIISGVDAPLFTMPPALNERPKLYPPLKKKGFWGSIFKPK